MKRVPLLTGLLLSTATAFSCDIDQIVARSETLVDQGRHYRALSWLEEASHCDHPRLDLERGELYFATGQYDIAIRVWQSVLKTDGLPESVASNVKLRIIQATLNPPDTWAGQMALSTSHEMHSISGQESSLHLAAASQWRLAPFNLFGYRTTPSLHTRLSSLQQYDWSAQDYAPLFLLKTGLELSTKPLQWSLATKAYAVDGEWVPALDTQLDRRFGSINFSSELEYRPISNRLRWRESITLNGKLARHRFSNTLDYESEQWRWDELSVSSRVNWTVRPQLTLSWHPEEQRTELEGELRWPLGKHIGLTTMVGTTLNRQPENWAKLSLTWQRP